MKRKCYRGTHQSIGLIQKLFKVADLLIICAKSFICVLDCFDEFFATAHLLFRICCTLAALFLFFRKLHKIFLSSKYPLFNLEILSRKLCIFRLSFCHAVRIGVC